MQNVGVMSLSKAKQVAQDLSMRGVAGLSQQKMKKLRQQVNAAGVRLTKADMARLRRKGKPEGRQSSKAGKNKTGK